MPLKTTQFVEGSLKPFLFTHHGLIKRWTLEMIQVISFDEICDIF